MEAFAAKNLFFCSCFSCDKQNKILKELTLCAQLAKLLREAKVELSTSQGQKRTLYGFYLAL